MLNNLPNQRLQPFVVEYMTHVTERHGEHDDEHTATIDQKEALELIAVVLSSSVPLLYEELIEIAPI